ncbi:hypothetical protein DM02DRAFT_588188 [Periconia macrospinosa]|uniref:Cytochrome b561 domain-containing protein n=1 Tax=Periconia macrospinosa TaxID=97972 RepID=A0A2V1E1J2_9PLEO|nr:hypothetical protein DM02DRAFT_588188 [Periconia macrospinosa]
MTEEFQDGQPNSSMLVYYSGVLALQGNGESFRSAKLYTPLLSQLIYIQRLLFLEYALPYRAYPKIGLNRCPKRGQRDRLDAVRVKYMVEGSMFPRTTNYRYPPEPSDNMPDYRIIKTWVEGDYHNAQLVCYGCDQWERNNANITSRKQSWIFSNHYDYVMQTDDVKKPLSLHTDYDVFELDMTVSHYADKTPVAPELIDNGRKSVGAEANSSWKPSQLFAFHGFLLASAFVVLMPLGVAGIRSGHSTAFKIHWVIQLTSAAFAVSGMVWGIYLTWGHPITIKTANGAHKTLGFTLLILMVLTPMLGYLHHLLYLKIGRATGVTVWHR